MIKIRTLAGAATIATIAALVPATAANAHDDCVAYGENVACVRNNHGTIDWCDRENDGRRVYAQYRIEFFGTVTTGYDPNGSNSGCGHQDSGLPISVFRVCEEGSGCSAFKPS